MDIFYITSIFSFNIIWVFIKEFLFAFAKFFTKVMKIMRPYRIIQIILSLIIISVSIFSIYDQIRQYNSLRYQKTGYDLLREEPAGSDALQNFKTAASYDDNNFLIDWYIAQILYNKGKYDEAVSIYINLTEKIDLYEIHTLLYNTYAKMEAHEQLIHQGINIFSRFSFDEKEHLHFEKQINPLIENQILYFIKNNDFYKLGLFLKDIFSIPFTNLPFEHYRGIKYALAGECDKALEYYIKNKENYINKQLLAIYAYCIEKSISFEEAQKIIKKEYENADKDTISRFLVKFYEEQKEDIN